MNAAGLLVDNRLNVGDQVIEISADYTTPTNYYVSAVSAGAATLTASS